MPLSPSDALDAHYDVCIVGAGPGGLACALGCHERGLKVLLLDAGGRRPIPGAPDILAAEIDAPQFHDPVEIVSASALGGTSNWWGGRVVPFDPIDFETWPIGYNELKPWYEDAAAFLGAKVFHASPAPGAFAALTDFDTVRDETWCPQINMAKRWRARIAAADGPTIVLGARVTGLDIRAARINSVRVRFGDDERTARADHVVLACGGLGTLRLMLLAQRETPALFGGEGGPLGRSYMGHLTGVIAHLLPSDTNVIEQFGFRDVGDGVFARRQINARAETLRREGLANIAFWLDNPHNSNPAHGSSVASAKYVAARIARQAASLGRRREEAPLKPHLDNIARAPLTAAGGLVHSLYLLATAQITGRLPRPRRFIRASAGGWHMRYHAEVWPDASNRIGLSASAVDSLGLPKLKVAYRPSQRDFESVVRAHEALNRDLQGAGAGRLNWLAAGDARLDLARQQGNDGYHQIGGAVMGPTPGKGVVDAECRAFGVDNLWLATSAVFPTGSQANPTLTIVALARRLAARLARR